MSSPIEVAAQAVRNDTVKVIGVDEYGASILHDGSKSTNNLFQERFLISDHAKRRKLFEKKSGESRFGRFLKPPSFLRRKV